jgi:uncharacterized damage-inducible protein DinB
MLGALNNRVNSPPPDAHACRQSIGAQQSSQQVTFRIAESASFQQDLRCRARHRLQAMVRRVLDLVPDPLEASTSDPGGVTRLSCQLLRSRVNFRMAPIDDVGRFEKAVPWFQHRPESLLLYHPMSDSHIHTLFLDCSRQTLIDEYWPRLRSVVESLSDEQVWWRPNEASNSVGNLLLHLNGNVRQWLVAAFDRLDDSRDRRAEFAQRAQIPAAQLLEALGHTLGRASAVLSRLTEADLSATYSIQGYTVTGLYAVYHVVEHFGMHYGQILYVAKLTRGKDLGFYRELDATGRLD